MWSPFLNHSLSAMPARSVRITKLLQYTLPPFYRQEGDSGIGSNVQNTVHRFVVLLLEERKKRQQKIQSAEFEYCVVSTAGVCEESTTVKSELTSVNPREKGSGCQEGGGELADSFTDKSARKRTNCVNDLFRVGTGTLSS